MDESKFHNAGGRVGHEQTDVDTIAIGKSALAMTLICIALIGMIFGMFKYLLSMEGGVSKPVAKAPPVPQLQKTPVKDLKAVRAEEDQALTTYGWVDQPKGVVRLPIAKAMDLVVQRGLTTRPPADMQKFSRDISIPTESGLGMKMVPSGGPLAGEMK